MEPIITYFSLMVVALVMSMIASYIFFKIKENIWLPFLVGTGLNLSILGFGCLWWLEVESDGMSQAFGVLYYTIAAGIIIILTLIEILFLRMKVNR